MSSDALEADHAWLLDGGVFTADLIETWIAYKRQQELAPVNCGRSRTSSSSTTTSERRGFPD